jgi:CRP/FNR family transcriptional regulator/CRP/FNR family nitrogen fixation transcriptional regulator
MYLKPCASLDEPFPIADTANGNPDGVPFRLLQRVAEGRHLFRAGDTAHHVYEVESGMMRLSRVLENGRRQIIAFGLPGDVVGFPLGDLHHTDCDAITDAVVRVHRKSTLDSTADPHLHLRLTRAALKEICAMQDHFMMLSSKSAAEKVAAFLLSLADRVGESDPRGLRITIAMLRVDIADFLGLTTETVCRTFTQFRKDGLIVLETAQQVIITDLPGLRARAEPD